MCQFRKQSKIPHNKCNLERKNIENFHCMKNFLTRFVCCEISPLHAFRGVLKYFVSNFDAESVQRRQE